MIFLEANITFDQIAALLWPHFTIADVAACIFPSRPEPRSAKFKIDELHVMDYLYLPDIELRYLHPFDDITAARTIACLPQMVDAQTTLWTQLESNQFTTVTRAAKALAILAETDLKIADRFFEAAQSTDLLQTKRVLYEYFASVAHPEHRDTIRTLLESNRDSSIRLHLTQAKNRVTELENRHFTRR